MTFAAFTVQEPLKIGRYTWLSLITFLNNKLNIKMTISRIRKIMKATGFVRTMQQCQNIRTLCVCVSVCVRVCFHVRVCEYMLLYKHMNYHRYVLMVHV